MLGVLAVIVGLPVVAFLAYYLRINVPEPQEVATAQVSTIFASDSATELARIVPPDGNRRQIPLSEMPEHVQDAVLAAEDREFWTNSGFSLTGFSRAVIGQLTGDDSAGGGSTITQQYVKNVLVGNDHSIQRKARELVYSIKMTNQWDKETILEAYLNTVYFGRNAYGIEAAANAYFNKPAAELSVEEGAMLAGLIQLPSQLDPWDNPEGSEARWNYVLDGMVEEESLSPGQRADMQFPPTRDPAEYSAYTEATGTNGHIKNHVIAELETVGITEEEVTTRGLQITTTIDTVTQQATLDAVDAYMPSLQEDAAVGTATVEPATGAVRGYYGGDDASGWDYGNAAYQTGSTFKIFGLAAALQQGIPLSAAYSSDPITLPGGSRIDNVSGYCGVCSIEMALQQSYNTSFIRLQQDLENTTQDTADMAHALGMARSLPGIPETLTENGEQAYEGIILGQYQSRPIDLAAALATLANRGVYHQTHWVERVETIGGEVLYEFDGNKGERRVSEQVADNLLQAMGPIAAYSNGSQLAGGRPSAAKTGTAQLGNTGLNRDAWMLGATPQLSTAVWVGTADNTSAIFNEWGGNMYGAGTPTKIWKYILDNALVDEEIQYFAEAEPINYGLNYYGGVPNYSSGSAGTQSGTSASSTPSSTPSASTTVADTSTTEPADPSDTTEPATSEEPTVSDPSDAPSQPASPSASDPGPSQSQEPEPAPEPDPAPGMGERVPNMGQLLDSLQ
ncbi:MAG TPA: transglycosylase domain-containing protein [Corynebacterium sp.]|nr:transglycosylase domain-containing protein [Corynebacterium sp.]